MKAKKVLFINQEITPYVPESEMSNLGRQIPQIIQEKGYEIRTFMPKWGNINERRGQLHEVIRLSRMMLIIDETDIRLLSRLPQYLQQESKFILSTTRITLQRGLWLKTRTELNTTTTASVQYSLHVACLKS